MHNLTFIFTYFSILVLISNTDAVRGQAIANAVLFEAAPDFGSVQPKYAGMIRFIQNRSTSAVQVFGTIIGELSTGKHGFHIHEKGILSNFCKDAGGHFNPENVNHGAPIDKIRHVGDLGNIHTEGEGKPTVIEITDSVISLYGKHSIIGRSVVVHQREDDLGKGEDKGSRITGNAGKRLFCGVICISNDQYSPETA